jgi:hypothetical protein
VKTPEVNMSALVEREEHLQLVNDEDDDLMEEGTVSEMTQGSIFGLELDTSSADFKKCC